MISIFTMNSDSVTEIEVHTLMKVLMENLYALLFNKNQILSFKLAINFVFVLVDNCIWFKRLHTVSPVQVHEQLFEQLRILCNSF